MFTKPLQPFLRFNMINSKIMNSTSGDVKFQPFLRFNGTFAFTIPLEGPL